jgi:hypothetical protein
MLSIKSTAGEAGTEAVGELPTTFTKPQTTLALTNTVVGSSSESGPAPTSETTVTSNNAANNVTQDSTTLFATNSPESVINITVTSFSNTNSTDTSTTSTSVVTSTATTTTPV